ncbi:MAG: D-2-hydroxyacid dehydrogenase [Bacteroidota bacterium]
MNISILDAKTLNPGDLTWDAFKTYGNLAIYPHSSIEEIMPRSKDAEIILVNKVLISKAIMDQLPNLKYIGVTATGYNNVDLEAAKAKGIAVTNAPGYGTLGVAQHTFALILELLSKVSIHNKAVKEGAWSNQDNFSLIVDPITGLENLTMGIIGFGTIGQKVAEIAKAFAMNVIIHTRTEKPGFDFPFVTRDQLIKDADIVSLHCNLNASNQEMVDEDFLSKMKSNAILINTARGGLINEQALASALQKGIIAGAGLDVLSEEPPASDHVLLSAKNCIVTPHNAWAYPSCRRNLMDIVLSNLKAFLEGKLENRLV